MTAKNSAGCGAVGILNRRKFEGFSRKSRASTKTNYMQMILSVLACKIILLLLLSLKHATNIPFYKTDNFFILLLISRDQEVSC